MKRLLLFLAPVVLLSTACQTVTPYAAVVNGEVISTHTMDDEVHAITSNADYAQALDQSLGGGNAGGGLRPGGDNTVSAQYLAQLVQNRVLVALIDQEVEAKHLQVTDAQRAQAEESVRADNDPAIWGSLATNYREYLVSRQAKLSAVVAARSTPEAQRAYYDANVTKFTEYCVSHILVNTKEQADGIGARLRSGEDFATIARAESIDNQSADGGSAAKGGDLGCYSESDLDQFIPEFRNGVRALQSGEVSGPVQSRFGFHIIKVSSKKQQSFDEAQAAIVQQLQSASAFFESALSTAKIKVNPRYGDYVPADAATGSPARVTPHQAPVLTRDDAPEGTDDGGVSGLPMQ